MNQEKYERLHHIILPGESEDKLIYTFIIATNFSSFGSGKAKICDAFFDPAEAVDFLDLLI